MDRIIETLASGVGNGVGWMAESGVLFGVFLLIWIAFGAALIWSQGSIDVTLKTASQFAEDAEVAEDQTVLASASFASSAVALRATEKRNKAASGLPLTSTKIREDHEFN